MKSAQAQMKAGQIQALDLKRIENLQPHLIVAFGSFEPMHSVEFQNFAKKFGQIPVIGCSTAGEVSRKGFFENTIVINAIRFDRDGSAVRIAHYTEEEAKIGNFESGAKLGRELNDKDLAGVMLLAPGVGANPPGIIHGLKSQLGSDAVVFGGLAGDGGQFKQTCVFYNGEFHDGGCVAVGFYGTDLSLKHSARGGWQAFGKIREITKAKDNFVLEIDGRPALDVYKEALGDHAKDLPKMGLSFPLSIVNNDGDEIGLMRAVLTVNEDEKSLVMAGDMVLEGRETGKTLIRFARGTNSQLVTGAREAAAKLKFNDDEDSFGFLISCVARKLVLGAAIDDEVEAVAEELEHCENFSGFYAYGEIGPFFEKNDCQLHNQTFTIALLSEKKAA